MGIDYGAAKIGLSLSSNSLALPYGIIEHTDVMWQKLVQLIHDEHVDAIVVGLPSYKSGQESPASRAVQAFIAQLKQHVDIPIHVFNEQFTSAQAQKMNVGKDDDAHAASLILQSYLDHQSHAN